MKQHFAAKLALAVVPLAILVTFTNYFADPANLFSGRSFVDSIASLLAKGHNVDGVSNYDERQLQEAIVKRINKSPEVLVLGSSRIMEVGKTFFQSASVMNAAVSHANIHDMIAITGMLDSMGRLPEKVLMNIDPSLVSLAATDEWQSLAVYHTSFMRRQHADTKASIDAQSQHKRKKLYSLVSFSYFRESVNFIAAGKKKTIIDASQEMPPHFGRYADGTICYPYNYTHPDTTVVRSNAVATASKEGLSLPDSNKIRLLEMLTDFFLQRQIKVEWVMLPYHPAYFQTVNAKQQYLFASYDALFRGMAAKKNISIYGNFNPAVSGITEADFYDMYHCSGTSIKKILTKAL